MRKWNLVVQDVIARKDTSQKNVTDQEISNTENHSVSQANEEPSIPQKQEESL